MEEVNRQLAVFENPRASYYSQESKVLAEITRAKTLALTNVEQAKEKLNDLIEQVETSQATLLKLLIEEAFTSIQPD